MNSATKLTESPIYRRFTRERDLALEKLLRQAQRKQTRILKAAIIRMLEMLAARYPTYAMQPPLMAKRVFSHIDQEIDCALVPYEQEAIGVWAKYRSAGRRDR